jgi:hypothetical protein
VTRPCPISPALVSGFFFSCLRAAHDRFRRGLLLNEEPLISHVCVEGIGVVQRTFGGHPYQIRSDGFILHRLGTKSRDEYGCDIVWTVRALSPAGQWNKTAYFQLKMITRTKIGKKPRVDLVKHQVIDAQVPGVGERAFVVAVDPDSPTAFVAALRGMKVTTKSGTMRFDCSAPPWVSLNDWMKEWFTCHVGFQDEQAAEERLGASLGADYREEKPRIRVRICTTIESAEGGRGNGPQS